MLGLQTIENHSKKKTTLYRERNEEKRSVFLDKIALYARDDRIYVDESGIDSYIHRSFGWATRGSLIYGEISGKRYARESFVAAKCGSQILAPFCFQGTCNTELFDMWIETFLVPALKPGQVVILDNATFHKSEKTRRLIENAQCTLLFLPPYSPDFNPIEKFWAWFKATINPFTISQILLRQLTMSFLCKVSNLIYYTIFPYNWLLVLFSLDFREKALKSW